MTGDGDVALGDCMKRTRRKEKGKEWKRQAGDVGFDVAR